AVGVLDVVVVTAAAREGRNHDHSDRAIVTHAFIPGDEDGAVVSIGGRGHDFLNFSGEPGVYLQHGIGKRIAGIVTVVTEVGCDKIVAGDVVAGQVSGHFGVRANVRNAVGTIWIIGSGHVIEIKDGIVAHCVTIHVVERDL